MAVSDPTTTPGNGGSTAQPTPFRFYDNRQKYLAFVNTCNEKTTVARRASLELEHVRPIPPSLRIFDADHPGRSVVAAGAPWFMALFGRDALLTSLMSLPLDPSSTSHQSAASIPVRYQKFASCSKEAAASFARCISPYALMTWPP